MNRTICHFERLVGMEANGLHCRSGGGFAPKIQPTTNARLFTTAKNIFVCHHFGNAVVIGFGTGYKKIKL